MLEFGLPQIVSGVVTVSITGTTNPGGVGDDGVAPSFLPLDQGADEGIVTFHNVFGGSSPTFTVQLTAGPGVDDPNTSVSEATSDFFSIIATCANTTAPGYGYASVDLKWAEDWHTVFWLAVGGSGSNQTANAPISLSTSGDSYGHAGIPPSAVRVVNRVDGAFDVLATWIVVAGTSGYDYTDDVSQRGVWPLKVYIGAAGLGEGDFRHKPNATTLALEVADSGGDFAASIPVTADPATEQSLYIHYDDLTRFGRGYVIGIYEVTAATATAALVTKLRPGSSKKRAHFS